MIASYKKTCEVCKKTFIAHKKHARFCSPKCRAKNHRNNNINFESEADKVYYDFMKELGLDDEI